MSMDSPVNVVPTRGTDFDTLLDNDWDAAIPCVANEKRDTHPAKYMVQSCCPKCGLQSRDPICRRVWVIFGIRGCQCKACRWTGKRKDVLWIVEVLR